MKAVAFYLPQYHVIPENEAMYGKGFTEWDNVKNAKPLFDGHYQPHIPHKLLGYYDLTNEKTLTLQHQFAYDNGIKAFCYYYYNIKGKRLLEKPLDIINKSKNIKNEFCICWPHVGWYNNKEKNPIARIDQEYSKKQAKILAKDIRQYFENPRYIRIDDKPLFLIFAPEHHPSMREYADILHEEAIKMGYKGIMLGGVEAYVGCHPDTYGFDCMVEFAPNWRTENNLSKPGEMPRRIDYAATLKFMLAKPIPDYIRMRCAFPGWDNTARRGIHGLACTGNDPELFSLALEGLAGYTKEVLPENMQYLFINAWNEWGEGCHLEPDEKDGFKYLEIVKQVMDKYS